MGLAVGLDIERSRPRQLADLAPVEVSEGLELALLHAPFPDVLDRGAWLLRGLYEVTRHEDRPGEPVLRHERRRVDPVVGVAVVEGQHDRLAGQRGLAAHVAHDLVEGDGVVALALHPGEIGLEVGRWAPDREVLGLVRTRADSPQGEGSRAEPESARSHQPQAGPADRLRQLSRHDANNRVCQPACHRFPRAFVSMVYGKEADHEGEQR